MTEKNGVEGTMPLVEQPARSAFLSGLSEGDLVAVEFEGMQAREATVLRRLPGGWLVINQSAGNRTDIAVGPDGNFTAFGVAGRLAPHRRYTDRLAAREAALAFLSELGHGQAEMSLELHARLERILGPLLAQQGKASLSDMLRADIELRLSARMGQLTRGDVAALEGATEVLAARERQAGPTN